MENSIASWMALGFMWIVFVLVPFTNGFYNTMEMIYVSCLMCAITYYGFVYKEVK